MSTGKFPPCAPPILRKAEERLEALLLEALQSAETELTPADWSDIRQEAIAQVRARQKAR